MSMDPLLHEAVELRARADRRARAGSAGRELAGEIDRQCQELATRLDPCRHRHRPEVWSSGAAEVSRALLFGGVGSDLWVARRHLLETRAALERQANALEREARADRRRADELERQATVTAMGG